MKNFFGFSKDNDSFDKNQPARKNTILNVFRRLNIMEIQAIDRKGSIISANKEGDPLKRRGAVFDNSKQGVSSIKNSIEIVFDKEVPKNPRSLSLANKEAKSLGKGKYSDLPFANFIKIKKLCQACNPL